MQKFILLFILLISTPAFADWSFNHQPYFAFEFGQQLEGDEGTEVAYVEVLFGYRVFFGPFKNEFYGEFRNYHIWSDSTSGYPFRIIYTIGNRFYFDNWYVEIEHFCNHSVYSLALQDRTGEHYWMNNTWGETRTTFAIGYKWN